MAGLKTKPEYKGLAEAVSLGIAVLKKAKQNTWAELVEGMDSGNLLVVKAFKALDLTDAQLEAVNSWQPVLNLVKINPAVIPVICPVCEYYVLTGDTAPTRCMVTAGCEGKPFKVAAATADTGRKSPAAAKTGPAASSEPEPAPEAGPTAAKTAPARRTVKKAASPDPMIEHMPDDMPEPKPVAEAAPPPGPSPEEDLATTPEHAGEPVLDIVLVADDEDPFA